jgi:archaellum component FlaC
MIHEPKFHCNICNKTYSSLYDLELHQLNPEHIENVTNLKDIIDGDLGNAPISYEEPKDTIILENLNIIELLHKNIDDVAILNKKVDQILLILNKLDTILPYIEIIE